MFAVSVLWPASSTMASLASAVLHEHADLQHDRRPSRHQLDVRWQLDHLCHVIFDVGEASLLEVLGLE